MPPEMIRGKAYNQAVDWWALGALIYEMVTGYPPFRHKNRKKLHHKILNERVCRNFAASNCLCVSTNTAK